MTQYSLTSDIKPALSQPLLRESGDRGRPGRPARQAEALPTAGSAAPETAMPHGTGWITPVPPEDPGLHDELAVGVLLLILLGASLPYLFGL